MEQYNEGGNPFRFGKKKTKNIYNQNNRESEKLTTSRSVSIQKDKSKNKKIIAIIVALVILITVALIFTYKYKKENMTDVFYLDQIAMKSTDPTKFKYTGRERDILGMSVKDYYLENGMYSVNKVAPQLFIDNDRYDNQTGYLGMPYQYRPKSLSEIKNLTE